MRVARDAVPPLDVDMKGLVEEGRHDGEPTY